MITGNDSQGASNPFEEMLKLQNKFQQSLAQATMSYVRQLQGLVGPVTPGTLVEVLEGQGVVVSVAPGSNVVFEITIENRQRVHTLVTPMLSPLVNDRGVTWFPEVTAHPTSKLLATDETGTFAFTLNAPAKAPVGVFRGACLIYGCLDGVVPIAVTIDRGEAEQKSTSKKSTASINTTKRTTNTKSKRKASEKKTTSKATRGRAVRTKTIKGE